jgi:hypothetical protein
MRAIASGVVGVAAALATHYGVGVIVSVRNMWVKKIS